MSCGTMLARLKLRAMAVGVGMSPAGAMWPWEYPEKPSSAFDDHPATVSAINTSAGMPRPLCSLRIMASVSGRLRLRTS